MSIGRCPIVRPQAGYFGTRGFTTDYHSWSKETGCCRFCGMTRKQAFTPTHDRFWGKEAEAAGRPPPHERFDALRIAGRWDNTLQAIAQQRLASG